MSNYQYTSDLKADVLFRAGEPTDGTSDYDTVALLYLNRAYQAIWQGGQEYAPDINEDWLWLHKTGILTLVPPVTSGTVTATKNSQTITFSTAPANPGGSAISVAGWYLRVTGHADVFKISAHTSGQTSATLDSVYTGETVTTSYTCFDIEYDLASDVLRLESPMTTRISGSAFPYRPGKIDVVGFTALREQWPLEHAVAGVPSMAAQIAEQTVRFNTYPSSYLRIEYDYLRIPSALANTSQEEPLVPLKDRRILADAALSLVFVDKNDNRADGLMIAVANHLRAMANENRARLVRMDKTFARIYPRIDRMQSRLPHRTSGGLVVA